jgi:hypothetical protein
MPETTEGLSTAVARGSLSEIGASTRYAGSMLTEAEAEAQRAEYLEHVAMGTLHSGLSIAQSNASLKKSAFTVELTSSKVENIMPILIKPFCCCCDKNHQRCINK